MILANTRASIRPLAFEQKMQARQLDTSTFDEAAGDLDWLLDCAESASADRFTLAPHGVLFLRAIKLKNFLARKCR